MDLLTLCVVAFTVCYISYVSMSLYRTHQTNLEYLCTQACDALQKSMELLIGYDADGEPGARGSRFKDFDVSVEPVGLYMHISIVWRGDGVGDEDQPDRSMAFSQRLKFLQKEQATMGTGVGGLAAAILTSAKATLAKHTPDRSIQP